MRPGVRRRAPGGARRLGLLPGGPFSCQVGGWLLRLPLGPFRLVVGSELLALLAGIGALVVLLGALVSHLRVKDTVSQYAPVLVFLAVSTSVVAVGALA